MEFKCSLCDYRSPLKLCVDRHVTKKKKCGPNPSVIIIDGSITCEYCKIVCKTTRLINDHYKVCKIRNQPTPKPNSKPELLMPNIKVPNVSNVPNVPNVPPNMLVKLKPYNDPKIPDNIDDICEEAWTKMKCVLTYIKRIYFDIKLPENHSMCISNIRVALGTKVFKGTSWEYLNTINFINNIVHKTQTTLDEWIMADANRQKYKDAYNRYVAGASLGALVKKYTDEREETKLLLYRSCKNGLVNTKSIFVTAYVEDTKL